VGESQFIRELKQRLPSIAGSDPSVLITGETGTGKEVVARAIHYLSKRRHRPFVPLHCGAVPSDLFENELFGHRRGAYTGAEGSQQGLIAQADHGTLFLDEISTLPMRDQEKLLRVLQEGEYRPIGGAGVMRADIRILAATNIDLEAAVQRGRFRIDLLYRINTLVVDIPPLKSRPEDILPLAHHFLRLYSWKYRKQSTGFSPAAIARLEGYEWPGNVRELQHVVESAVALTTTPEITEVVLHGSQSQPVADYLAYRDAKHQAVEQFQREYLTRLVQAAGGNLSRAARMAGVERAYFSRLLRRHCICVEKER
jgi:two-component system response regulator GlrR